MATSKTLPSSPTLGPLSESLDSNFVKNACSKYHSNLDMIHTKIYRYNNFEDLVHYLKTTLNLNLPYINYPSKEILMMILTATQLNHVEDKSSSILLNFSVPCIEYISQLFEILENTISFDKDEHQILYDEEISNLYHQLEILFSFLKPSSFNTLKRPKRKRTTVNTTITNSNNNEVLELDDSLLDYSMDENIDILDKDIRDDKIRSLYDISTTSDKFNDTNIFFGIKYLSETEKNLWKYVTYSLTIASRLTEIERPDSYECYTETWCRWREFLYILIRFMDIELVRSKILQNSLLISNILNISDSDPFDATEEQYLDSLLTFVDYIFTNSTSAGNISPIIPSDLTLNQKYNFRCNPSMLEYKFKGSGICLDSLPIRSKFLITCWKYLLKLSIPLMTRIEFCKKIAKKLVGLKPKELMDFFFNSPALLDIREVSNDILFTVSFEVMSLLCRSWTMTSDNFIEDYLVYLNQLKTLFDSCCIDSSTKKENTCLNHDLVLLFESCNDKLEKCFILARYQLQITLKSFSLSDKEWEILNSITFNYNNKVICLGTIAQRFVPSSGYI